MMDAPAINHASGSPADKALLSKATRRTLEALYRHPMAHNLEWADVVTLFRAIGAVDQKSHNDITFTVGGARHKIRKPHSKDITMEELLEFRRILTLAGWSPEATHADVAGRAAPADAAPAPDLLVVIEHHEARIFHLDTQSAETTEHAIKPYDPHHFLHHLSHKDQSRERGQRAPEDTGFYVRLAAAVAPAHAIVVVGHGAGHSNAADHFMEHLRLHHTDTFGKVVREAVADLSSLTPPQLLALGRRALSAPRQPPHADQPAPPMA